jgi:hypothetical protein
MGCFFYIYWHWYNFHCDTASTCISNPLFSPKIERIEKKEKTEQYEIPKCTWKGLDMVTNKCFIIQQQHEKQNQKQKQIYKTKETTRTVFFSLMNFLNDKRVIRLYNHAFFYPNPLVLQPTKIEMLNKKIQHFSDSITYHCSCVIIAV